MSTRKSAAAAAAANKLNSEITPTHSIQHTLKTDSSLILEATGSIGTDTETIITDLQDTAVCTASLISTEAPSSMSPTTVTTGKSTLTVGGATTATVDCSDSVEPTTPTSKENVGTMGSEIKRRRRPNSSLQTTPTTSNQKKSLQTYPDDSDDVSSLGEIEDDKSIKDYTKTEKDAVVGASGSSPVRRKRRVFDKTGIMTRKSTMDLAKNSARTLRGTRGNSNSGGVSSGTTGAKVEAVKERDNSRKRTGLKKVTTPTCESQIRAVTPTKRKRENSTRAEESHEKQIKLESPNDDQSLLNESPLLNDYIESDMISSEGNAEEETSSNLMQIPQELEDQMEIEQQQESVEETTIKQEEHIEEIQPMPRSKRGRPIKRINQLTQVTKKYPGKREKAAAAAAAIASSIQVQSDSPGNHDVDNTKSKKSRETTFAEDDPEGNDNRNDVNKDNKLNGIENSLTVDTTSKDLVSLDEHQTKSSVSCGPEEDSKGIDSDKAASLSPELVSEGVNILSVKQFYKKPEFLENNLGIEKDPKLGEIVQEAEKTTSPKRDSSSISSSSGSSNQQFNLNDKKKTNNMDNSASLKENETLILEESFEEVEEVINSDIGDNNFDDNIEAPVLLPEIDTTSKENDIDEIEMEGEEDNKEAPELEIETVKLKDSKDSVPKNVNILRKCDNEAAVDVKNIKDEDKNVEIKDEDDSESVKEIDIKHKISYEIESGNDTNRKKLRENLIKIVSSISNERNENVDILQDQINDNEDHKHSTVCPIQEEDNEELMIDESEINEEIMDAQDKNENVEEFDCKNSAMKMDDCMEKREHTNIDLNIVKKRNRSPAGTRKIQETPETLKQKENHFKSLGLLTLKAADEAKIEKLKRREFFQSTTGGSSKKNSSGSSTSSNSSNCSSNGNIEQDGKTTANGNAITAGAGNNNKKSVEYTGTLKTVIKINRQMSNTNSNESKRKTMMASSGTTNDNHNSSSGSHNTGAGRVPLKMTFQKGRGRNSNNDKDSNHSSSAKSSTEDTYYTIHNEADAMQETLITTHGRKSHNRSHTIEPIQAPDAEIPGTDKKDEKEIIVIPEKASSFSIHPGRLCQDQCFYCGGKFGLYDTPCHVAQIKSTERQQRILDTEEKLTADNCLCDACFRHVDRRANVPSYKKRLSAPPALETNCLNNDEGTVHDAGSNDNKSPSTLNATDLSNVDEEQYQNKCFVTECMEPGSHTVRRKCLRKTIRKLLPQYDLSTLGGLVPICNKHHDIIVQCLGCALCKRRLVKNHMYHITQDAQRLEKLLSEQGIPVQLGNSTAVCKLCRYFTNLLIKPPDGKTQKAQFVKNYRRRLLHFHNIQSGDGSDCEDQIDINKNTNLNNEDSPLPAKRGRKPKQQVKQQQNHQDIVKLSREDSNTPQSSEEGTNLMGSTAQSGQMMLDNDVMVDYDVPIIPDSPSPPPASSLPSKLQTILQGSNSKNRDDISIVLRSNPNISMRELFPGEEEMGLQVNLPFGSSASHRTPEGWTRVQTFLQYDEPTRRLWEDLQKPYGNQSSFLRHLILLEKYFRNGDLVLSQNATSNAVVYSESVQNRLRSYDNSSDQCAGGHNKTNNNTANMTHNCIYNYRPTISQILQDPDKIQQQFSNLPITITARPKQAQQQQNSSTTSNNNNNYNINSDSNDSNSILKSNLLGSNTNSVEILPISSGNSNNRDGSQTMTKQQKLLAAASRLINNDDNAINTTGSKKSSSNNVHNNSLPPELISINRGQNSLLIARNNRSHQQQLHHQQHQQQHQHFHQQHHSKSSSCSKLANMMHNIIKLPETLTQMERLQSKSWRPTLMPVSSGAHLNQSGPLYQTADGRRLPALVQVQSGGRPYLISIHDYNRMCILRREKILREQMLKGNSGNVNTSGYGGSGSKNHNNPINKSDNENNNIRQFQSNKMQIPNKILEQNSLIPVCSGGNKKQHHHNPHQQTSLLKSSTITSPQSSGPYLVPIAPKPQSSSGVSSQLQILPQSSSSSLLSTTTSMQPNIVQNSLLGGGTVSFLPTISNVLSLAPQSVNSSNASWLWNNLNDGNPGGGGSGNIACGNNNNKNNNNNIHLNGGLNNKNIITSSSGSGSSSNSSSPTSSSTSNVAAVTAAAVAAAIKQQQNSNLHHNSGIILDNSLLSKIPKSLTVIPQQKGQGRLTSRVNSIEDLTSA